MPTLVSTHNLELMLLGGVDVRLNGVSVTGISYNKMRALLAYLAVEREQDHSREALAELLWSERDPVTARGNLRRTLADLRRVLELPHGNMMFLTTKNTIRFMHNMYVDVQKFTQQIAPPEDQRTSIRDYERAIALYRGEFMAGFSLPDCPNFENWLQIQRETLHRQALFLLDKLSNYYKNTNNYNKSLVFSQRFVDLEPWDEEAHRRVMLLYALNGQSKAALTQFDTCCRLLKTELGIVSSEKTRLLADRIRSGELCAFTDNSHKEAKEILLLRAGRRQVTILYCELTSVAIEDPDEVMALLQAPQIRCVEIIRRFSGHIVQAHGGGLLAYFGYPLAREDACRAAVYSALTLIREITPGIEIRAGVHTGLIITGGDSTMPDIIGTTSKIAIQLRQYAASGGVTISGKTRDIIGGYFDCISQGMQSLTGFSQPVEIFKVIQENGARTRLDASVQLTPLIGRHSEIDNLLQLWIAATQGVQQVVLIQGEAGLGKSRLLHTLKQRLSGETHAIRELLCFPEFSQSPFHPLISMLEAIFGFENDDTPEVKLKKLAEHLNTHSQTSAQHAYPLLAQLFSLPLMPPLMSVSPQKQKELTIAILLDLLQSLALQQPVLLIVEDLHWIDPSTLELLTQFIERKRNAPICAVLTARPGFVPLWDESLVPTLALAPLVDNEISELVASLNCGIPASTLHRIVQRADGIPLFAEEMAKIATLDNQTIIPVTLHDLLAARMDSMGEAKYTAQLAATIGREFDLNLLRKVYTDSSALLEATLNDLQDAGLILQVREQIMQFKHALIQEAAYQSQTRAHQQAAHQRIVNILLSDFDYIVNTQPEIIAQHYAAAGETQHAVEFWIKAGQRAALNCANREAIDHFGSALQCVSMLVAVDTRDRLEAEINTLLGTVLIATKGYGSIEAGQAYARAHVLSTGDNTGLHNALWGMWLTSSSRINHAHSLELAVALLRLAELNDDALQNQQAHYAMGNSLLWTGQLEKSRLHLEMSMALYQPSHHEFMIRSIGENICVSSGSQLAWVLWLQGLPKQAAAIDKQTIILARQLNHPYSLCYAQSHSMSLGRWMRQVESTRLLAEDTMTLADQYGFPLWMLSSSAFHGWSQVMQGQLAGIKPIQHAVNTVRAAMSGIEAFFLVLLVESYVHSGQIKDALSMINEALTVMDTRHDYFLKSEMIRLKGVCQLEISGHNAAEAEACFKEALVLSRCQGAKSLELRSTLSLADLWRQQGKSSDARRMLEKVYDSFTEGHDTHDLQQAANLLLVLV